jgi:2-hydroxylaminobenzoate mutase
MTSATENLLDLLDMPMRHATAVDLTDAHAARAELESRYPSEGHEAQALRNALLAAVDEGAICNRGKDPVRYSRLAKPEDTPHDLSVDFVWMTGGGINHRHPRGEVNLCFSVEGDAKFDGQSEGWVTFAPESTHVPTVTDGRMLIVYFLPGGEVEWINEGKA